MSEEEIKNLTKEEGEWKIPDEVHDSNWRDDIPEEYDAEKASYDFEDIEERENK